MITLDSPKLKNISPPDLGEMLIKAKKAYYSNSKPIMDDHTYDTLEDILREKSPHHRIFKKIGSPGFDTGWNKTPHVMNMGSQNKVSTYKELLKYFRLKKIPTTTDFIVQPKCDGISLEIIYEKGQVASAITRGNGKVGDLITQNVVLMKNFVPKLKSTFTGSVRYEIIVTLKDFNKLNQISPENYSNPRNAAAGISQRLDSQFCSYCTLLAVDISSSRIKSKSEDNQVKQIKKMGISTVETHHCSDLNQVEKIYQQFLNQKRQDYDYDIDGLVVKINPVRLQQRLGSLNNRPKFQVAYKFPAATSTTRIKAIRWQTGPLGTVTPVAQVEPIELSGALITYASLANYQLVKQKNINVGDVVKISRRGDVIPYIEKVVNKINQGTVKIPQKCPSCKHQLTKEDKFLRCPNSKLCPSQTLGSLRLFCKFLDIKGISTKTIQKLVKNNQVKLPGDFYQLQISDINHLAGLGDKSAINMIRQIQAKKNITLAQAFTAAAIPNFSAKRVRQVIKAGFNTPSKIINLTTNKLESLPGFQSTLAQKIINGITSKKPVINSILSQVKIKTNSQSSKLTGLFFAVTGTLSHSRKEITTNIESAGGQVVSAISKNTDYLVCNQKVSKSSKFITAKKLGIKIISETRLHHLIS